jgi:hypothetical protein
MVSLTTTINSTSIHKQPIIINIKPISYLLYLDLPIDSSGWFYVRYKGINNISIKIKQESDIKSLKWKYFDIYGLCLYNKYTFFYL